MSDFEYAGSAGDGYVYFHFLSTKILEKLVNVTFKQYCNRDNFQSFQSREICYVKALV